MSTDCDHPTVELRRQPGAWRATCMACEAWATTFGQLDHPRLALRTLTGGVTRYQPARRKPADTARPWIWQALEPAADAADAA